jgi:hypothetical protein
LGANGFDDYRVPIEWLEPRLSAVPAPSRVVRLHFPNAFGGLLLRAGRLDEAIDEPFDRALAGALELGRGLLEHLRPEQVDFAATLLPRPACGRRLGAFRSTKPVHEMLRSHEYHPV